jgi:hypothetical protein
MKKPKTKKMSYLKYFMDIPIPDSQLPSKDKKKSWKYKDGQSGYGFGQY